MAMVRKLALQGVRSFSPEDAKGQFIEFGSPLTLILGINGSGKTTIIESLKYAITGQFPPNSSKGASFVNDPKLTFNDSSVAKVILELVDKAGTVYTATKKVKTIIKSRKGDLSTSQLEGTLRFVTLKGEKKQITSKCNDIKVELCRIMGVSEAILSYVIFCHQEESCWPLDEGKKVKETFDAIFNTTAYKKCFDKLTAEDKKLGEDCKIEAAHLEHAKDNRKTALQYREELDQHNVQFELQNVKIKEYEKSVEEMEKKLRKFHELEQDYATKLNEVTKKKTNLDFIQKQIEELKANIKEEFTGSTDELKEELKNFSLACAEKRKEISKHQRLSVGNDQELSKLASLRAKLLKEEGMFQQEENANRKHTEELDCLISEALKTMKALNLDHVDASLSASFRTNLQASQSEQCYDTVNKALASALRVKEAELKSSREEFEREEEALQKVIDAARGKRVSMEKERDMKQQQLRETKDGVNKLKTRLKSLEGSNERLKLLDDDEETLVENIESIEKSGFMMKCDGEIKELTKSLKEMEKKQGEVQSTFNLLNADKSKTDQIAQLNRLKLQKQNDCNEVMRKMEDGIKQVLGEVPSEGLGKKLEDKLKELNKQLRGLETDQKSTERAVTVAQAQIDHVTKELKKMETKLKTNRDRVADILDDRFYDVVYTEVSEKLDTHREQVGLYTSGSFLYKRFLAKLNKSDCCPLCKRDFEAESMTKKLVEEIEGQIKKFHDELPNAKEQVEKVKDEQQRILNIKPRWDEIKQLEEETIPSLKTKKREEEEKVETLKDSLDNVQCSAGMLRADVEMGNKCRPQVALYEQSEKEVKKFDEQIAKLERSRDPTAKACGKTMTDVEAELDELKRSIGNTRTEKDSKESTRNKKRDELDKLKHKKNQVKEEKLKITAELQNREALEEQRKSQELLVTQLTAKIAEVNDQLPSVKSEIQNAEKAKTSYSQKKESALQKLRDEKGVLDKHKLNIADKHRLIVEFEKKKDKFVEVQERITQCAQKLKDCDTKKKEIENTLQSLKDDVVNQELKERELKDNLSLKEKIGSLSELRAELREKEKILEETQNKGVTAERRQVQDKHRETEAKLNGLKGRQIELRDKIKEKTKELAKPQLANADAEYVKRYARKLTFEKAQKDVRRYKVALDLAIMQFHKKRMEKINMILLDYWRRIYKGNDIDKIMIKTESDKEPAGQGKVKVTMGTVRKNYNYRVVMVRRGGVEIDMRGRCSAGQRVLASIIIRIALAESFGARCGIITLDEPTTNLDKKNINSLADALTDLADKMSSRVNFQLIVITHDQDFTDRLSSVDAVEKYWKVDRDREGFSRITMVPKRGVAGPSKGKLLVAAGTSQ